MPPIKRWAGDLAVDPTHLRDLLKRQAEEVAAQTGTVIPDPNSSPSSDRSRRIRDAVEAALSDVILLGTEEQVRLAAQAANDLAAGRATHTHDLVVSLRDFIRQVLDLEPVPVELAIPRQGPTRAGVGTGSGKGKGSEGGDRDGSKQGGKGMSGMAGAGGLGLGLGGGLALDTESGEQH